VVACSVFCLFFPLMWFWVTIFLAACIYILTTCSPYTYIMWKCWHQPTRLSCQSPEDQNLINHNHGNLKTCTVDSYIRYTFLLSVTYSIYEKILW
jgi:hypothetical protein